MSFSVLNRCLDHSLVADIVRILDEADIPSLLWGNYLLTVFGVPTIVQVSFSYCWMEPYNPILNVRQDASFVIPDNLISMATSTLMSAGFEDCSAYPTCTIVNARFRCSPIPAAHVHIDQTTYIQLFNKSETLWRLDISPPSIQNPGKVETCKDILIASDPCLPSYEPGRGRGAFSPTLHTVRIPSANRLLEAYMLLMIRDRSHIYETFWSVMLTYINEYVEEAGLIKQEELEPWCRDLYHVMFTSGRYIGKELDELKKDKSLAPDR